ncbi:MAG: ATP-binding cassette domain-containing protein [Bacteroidia bacterium]|nr:ATP-binding cassette domain-containing protein [Bacteroidia bacterium]
MSARINNNLPKASLNKENVKRAFRIFQFIRKSDRWLFAIGTVFLALTAGAAILIPKLLGNLVDGAFTSVSTNTSNVPSANQLEQTAIYFVYLFIAQAVFSFLRISIYVRVTENLTYALRKSLYNSVLLQNMDFFSKNRVGDLLSRFSADVSQIQDSFTTNIAMFLRQLLIIVAGVVLLFFTSTKLALMMLATVPVVVVISLIFGKYIRKISRQVQDFTADNNVIVEETLSGIVNVKSFTNEAYEINRYGNSAEKLRKESIYRGLLRGGFSSFIIVCLFGSIIFLIFQGLTMVRAGQMPIGELFEFMMLTGFVGGSIGGIAEQFVQIQKTIGAVDRVLDIIDQPGEKLEVNHEIIGETKHEITFKNVAFSYPSRSGFEVLKNVNFSIKPGESLAIVGPSGAGKSTLVNLMYRFYEPTAGAIYLGNENIADRDLYQIRHTMALVPQEIMLFGGTIEDNIRYGNPDATEEMVVQAAQRANAHDFISGFPEAYKTIVGDRGIRLSGGQRQRVAIARAILRNPQILLLDEATSSLDSESESLVQAALEELMKGRTNIIIAHRLSTIRNCNYIAVLQQGNIAEYGSHEDLMKIPNGLYKKMVERQQEPNEFFDDSIK